MPIVVFNNSCSIIATHMNHLNGNKLNTVIE